jgi:hypothetical protein
VGILRPDPSLEDDAARTGDVQAIAVRGEVADFGPDDAVWAVVTDELL